MDGDDAPLKAQWAAVFDEARRSPLGLHRVAARACAAWGACPALARAWVPQLHALLLWGDAVCSREADAVAEGPVDFPQSALLTLRLRAF